MQNKISILAALLLSGVLGISSSANAATITWDFNLPATAISSQNPPYPSVALLTLEDKTCSGGVNCVLFTLDPNESNPGYEQSDPSKNSTVNALNIAYHGVDLSSSAYESFSGPVANADTFGNSKNPLVAVVKPPTSALNLDTGYSVPNADGNGQLLLTWNNPDFPVSEISIWYLLGTTIADNFSLMAESNSKPSATFGIFSVSRISLTDPNPTPSNWVTAPSPVPVPAAFWLFGTALMGFISLSRRTRV